MPREAKAYLYDMRQAATLIATSPRASTSSGMRPTRWCGPRSSASSRSSARLSAQLARLEPETASRIGDHRRIIAFRNILVHGYAGVDDMLVWDMVATRLAGLQREVDELLGAG